MFCTADSEIGLAGVRHYAPLGLIPLLLRTCYKHCVPTGLTQPPNRRNHLLRFGRSDAPTNRPHRASLTRIVYCFAFMFVEVNFTSSVEFSVGISV